MISSPQESHLVISFKKGQLIVSFACSMKYYISKIELLDYAEIKNLFELTK